ncbi:MAG: beta-propeller fold lactonase family protein [Dokdonella sp.]|uniref:beta-propeller fold lactonase family protein n=1 Tax=Dokdonella sp. TaxID=2291710 RepID=UPI003263F8D4
MRVSKFHIPMKSVLAGVLCTALATPQVLAAPFAYVPNQKSGSISVIDVASDTVTRTLTASGKLGKRLQAIDVSSDGKVLYVVDAEHNDLFAIDPVSDSVVRKVAIGDDAEGVRLSPSGNQLAVCAEGQNLVLLIDAKTLRIDAKIPVKGRNPEHCEFTPDGKHLVTSNEGSDNLDVIDLATRVSTGVIATSGHPRGAAFLPDGSLLYVAQESANKVDVINVAERKKTRSIDTALRTAGLTITSDGKRIYATNGGAGSVSVIDTATNKVIREIPVGKRPWNMALTPDGKKLYVANGRSNSVSVIDTVTLAVVKEIAVGELPWGVVISP